MEKYKLEFWEQFIERNEYYYNQFNIRLIIFDNKGIYATFENETTPTFQFNEYEYFTKQLQILVFLYVKRGREAIQ